MAVGEGFGRLLVVESRVAFDTIWAAEVARREGGGEIRRFGLAGELN